MSWLSVVRLVGPTRERQQLIDPKISSRMSSSISKTLVFTTMLPCVLSVERWGQWELNLTGPSDGNPFIDIEFNATFSLATGDSSLELGSPPTPLVAFDFEKGGDTTHAVNEGTSKSVSPLGQLIAVPKSGDAPAGLSGECLDLGVDVTKRHVLEVPGDKQIFAGGVAGLSALTITGWLKVTGSAMGDGGNRVVNYCNGGGGVDLVWDSEYGGRLKLAINEWPDGQHPHSSNGSMPLDDGKYPGWRFFAVTYDASADVSGNNVEWYFGDSIKAATLDQGAGSGSYRYEELHNISKSHNST